MQLIVNRAPNGQLNDGVREEIEKHRLKLLGVLPQDETVYEADCEGKPSAQGAGEFSDQGQRCAK